MKQVDLYKEKTINKIVSRLPEVRAAVRFHAERIGAKASMSLAAHRYEGEAYIEVEHFKVDSIVWLVDDAAMSIEFGHIHNKSGEYVQGLYIISRAAGLV